MFRTAPRTLARAPLRALARPHGTPTRRFISTAPPAQKSRSWKSLFARLGAAGGIIYYYNTTDVFGDDMRPAAPLAVADAETDQLPTIEQISAERQQRRAVQAQLEKQRAAEESAQAGPASDGSVENLEAEAGQQGAFNPETGEINWDCPCLGGMAHGPCGDEFRNAFSCFVYSTEEPKGMDCIDKFKGMQDCFRQYPEIYGAEIDRDDAEDDDDDDFQPASPAASTPADSSSNSDTDVQTLTPAQTPTEPIPAPAPAPASPRTPPPSQPHSAEKVAENRRELGLVPESYRTEETDKKAADTESVVPKAAHDGRE